MHLEAILFAGVEEGQEIGEKPKSLVEFDGVPCVTRIAEALLDARSVDSIAVVGPSSVKHALPESSRLTYIFAPGPFFENYKAAKAVLPDSGPVIFVLGDQPFVDGDSFDTVVERFAEQPVDTAFFLPVIPHESTEPFEPEYHRPLHYIGTIAAKESNTWIVRPELIPQDKMERVFSNFFRDRDYTNGKRDFLATIYRHGGAKAAGTTLMMGLNYSLQSPFFSKFTSKKAIEDAASRILGAKVVMEPMALPEFFLEYDNHPGFRPEHQILQDNFGAFKYKILRLRSPKRYTVGDMRLSPLRKFWLLNRWTLSYLGMGFSSMSAGIGSMTHAIKNPETASIHAIAGLASLSAGLFLSFVGAAYVERHNERFEELREELLRAVGEKKYITEDELREVGRPYMEAVYPCPRSTFNAALEAFVDQGYHLWHELFKTEWPATKQYWRAAMKSVAQIRAVCR